MDKLSSAAWGARDIIREFQPITFEYPHGGKKIIASMRLTLDPLSRSETLIVGVLDIKRKRWLCRGKGEIVISDYSSLPEAIAAARQLWDSNYQSLVAKETTFLS